MRATWCAIFAIVVFSLAMSAGTQPVQAEPQAAVSEKPAANKPVPSDKTKKPVAKKGKIEKLPAQYFEKSGNAAKVKPGFKLGAVKGAEIPLLDLQNNAKGKAVCYCHSEDTLNCKIKQSGNDISCGGASCCSLDFIAN